jgi:hypothetical protein
MFLDLSTETDWYNLVIKLLHTRLNSVKCFSYINQSCLLNFSACNNLFSGCFLNLQNIMMETSPCILTEKGEWAEVNEDYQVGD